VKPLWEQIVTGSELGTIFGDSNRTSGPEAG
jgi:hypothetical protein